MNTTRNIALALVATLGLSAVATAQPRHQPAPHDRVVVVRDAHHPRHAGPVRYAPPVRHAPPVRYVPVRDHRFAQYHRGQRLPAAYRGPQYVVNDWRGQHLAAPPAGHQWVRDGRDFALVAIATGLIASIVLNH